jgi:hypothetical protein
MWTKRKKGFYFGLVLFLVWVCSDGLVTAQEFSPSLWESGELESLLEELQPLPDQVLVLNAGEMRQLLNWLVNERTYRERLKQSNNELNEDLELTLSLLRQSNLNQQRWEGLYAEQSRELVRTRTNRVWWAVGGLTGGFVLGFSLGR